MSAFHLWTTCLLASLMAFGADTLQSEFRGGLQFKLWEAAPSEWNVETPDLSRADYLLRRGHTSGGPFIELTLFNTSKTGLKACFSGVALRTQSNHTAKQEVIEPLEGVGVTNGATTVFRINTDRFNDKAGEQIVTQLAFEVFDGTTTVFKSGVSPMYFRGPQVHHGQRALPAHRVHGSTGGFTVVNLSSHLLDGDKWEGCAVRPQAKQLQFLSLNENARLGLHRHLTQEFIAVLEGRFVFAHGVARRNSSIRTVERPIGEAKQLVEVREYDAVGYLEQRPAGPKDLMVIVPDPLATDLACFHGLLALTEGTLLMAGE